MFYISTIDKRRKKAQSVLANFEHRRGSGEGEEGERIDDDVSRDEDMGRRNPVRIPGVCKPTAEMVREHEESGHVDYRPWCRACVGDGGGPDSIDM